MLIHKGLGERLRQRAKVLGLTDSEVARRLGLSQGRYSNYVNEVVEPDLGTLVRASFFLENKSLIAYVFL